MDLITDLPYTEGYDSVLVVVDRFSKYAHFIPTTKAGSADDTALLYINNVVALWGLPETIISDRDKRFLNQFWTSLWKRCCVKQHPSTAFHPQTDGQTERVNSILEQYLCTYATYQQDNWVTLLPFAQFSQ